MSAPSFDSMSNAMLIDRFRRRDQLAFAELFRRHRDLVYRVCVRLLNHHHDAEDVTQETFRRAAASIDRFDSKRPFEPWLVTIAGNRCRTFLAQQKTTLTIDRVSETAVDDPVDEATLFQEDLAAAMARLPERSQIAFRLIHQSGLSYDQASLVMGHPPGTIRTWVHRARLALVRDLQRSNDVASSSSRKAAS